MGTISEYFRYLETEPRNLPEVVKTFSHLDITPEIKEQRRELKLYKDDKINEQTILSI